jgi:hypothetical protein
MKIYFCDGCNESVPLVDVQSGRITTIKGKLFCSNCIPPGAVGPNASPLAAPPSRSSSPALLMILVLLLLGWTAWRDWSLMMPDSPPMTEVSEDERDPLSDLELRAERVDQKVMQLMADSEQSSRALTSLRGDLEGLRAADAESSRSSDRLADDIDRLARTQAEMSQVIEKVQHNSGRADALSSRLDAISDSVAAHQALLSMNADASSGGVVSSGQMGGPNAPDAAVVDPARLADIEEIRRMLRDPEPDLRFEAVDRVESGHYEELGPDLVTMLDDEDMFVRLHAMHALETLAYEDSVPALFDVLEDEHAAIRKTAAETLVRLTGFDPGFDPKGSKSERAKAVSKWRDWYADR